MEILEWNFRPKITETSFGSFGCQFVKITEEEMNETQKPPMGLIPKEIARSKRFLEVCGAISRYYNEGLHIQVKWVEEYNELVEIVELIKKD